MDEATNDIPILIRTQWQALQKKFLNIHGEHVLTLEDKELVMSLINVIEKKVAKGYLITYSENNRKTTNAERFATFRKVTA